MYFLHSLLFRLSASLSISPNAGWLGDLEDWFYKLFKGLWDALVNILKDIALFVLDLLMQVVMWIVNAIPVPDWLSNYSIGSFLGGAGPTIGWVVGELRIGDGLAIIAAGYAFRLVRKLVTLFQW